MCLTSPNARKPPRNRGRTKTRRFWTMLCQHPTCLPNPFFSRFEMMLPSAGLPRLLNVSFQDFTLLHKNCCCTEGFSLPVRLHFLKGINDDCLGNHAQRYATHLTEMSHSLKIWYKTMKISLYKGAFLEGKPDAYKRAIAWNPGILALLHPFKVAGIHIERLTFQRFESIPCIVMDSCS